MIWLIRPRSGIVAHDLSMLRDDDTGLVEVRQSFDFIPVFGVFYIAEASCVVQHGLFRKVRLNVASGQIGVIHHGRKLLEIRFEEVGTQSEIPLDWTENKVHIRLKLQDGKVYNGVHAAKMRSIVHGAATIALSKEKVIEMIHKRLRNDDPDSDW